MFNGNSFYCVFTFTCDKINFIATFCALLYLKSSISPFSGDSVMNLNNSFIVLAIISVEFFGCWQCMSWCFLSKSYVVDLFLIWQLPLRALGLLSKNQPNKLCFLCLRIWKLAPMSPHIQVSVKDIRPIKGIDMLFVTIPSTSTTLHVVQRRSSWSELITSQVTGLHENEGF